MGPDDWPEWLPGDWTVQIRKINDKKVKCYVDPDGHKCYSKPQVFDYLKKTNKSIPTEKVQNADGSAIDLSLEPNAPPTDEVPEPSPGGPPAKLTPRTSRRKTNYADLSEGFLSGDGSSSEPLSRKTSSRGRHTGDTSWLPAEWTVEEKFRKAGSSTGMKYKIYTEPITGRKFFSKPQVLKYLGKTDGSEGGQEAVYTEPISAMPISSWQENPTTEPDNSQIHEATEGKKKTEKKSESSRMPFDYEVVSRTPAEGLPAGWIKEVRMRKSGATRRCDPFYVHPSVEYAFFSKKDALRYLESGDLTKCVIKPLKRDMNKDDTINVNLTSSGGELTPPPDQTEGAEASKDITNGSAEELETNGNGVENPKPVRSITGGSFSTPNTTRKARSTTEGSFSISKEDSDWLPEGWLVDVRYKNSGVKYKIYKDPVSGKLFYSKPQVLSFLGLPTSSNSRKRKEPKSSVAPDSSPDLTTPADAKRPKRSVKKKGKGNSEDSDFQEIITTSAADGLPQGWIKELRTKIYATHKRSDPFYTDPVTGYIFRSKLDALRFIETGDVNLCAIRPKVKDKDGNEVFVYTAPVQKPTTGDAMPTETPEENHTPDPKTADTPNRRVSNRVTKNNTPPANTPARSSKRQKGKTPETTPSGPSQGNGAGQEKPETGVNLEKQPDDGNLAFDIPEDDNWTDQCIDFAVKTLTNEILFNGQPISGGFQEENAGVEPTTGVKDSPQTKVN